MSLEEGGIVSFGSFEIRRDFDRELTRCSLLLLLFLFPFSQVDTSCESLSPQSRSRSSFPERRFERDFADTSRYFPRLRLQIRFTGMAIRVVQDLGMQHEISLAPRGEDGAAATGSLGESQREEIARRRLLFWAVFLMDRFISWGVGWV